MSTIKFYIPFEGFYDSIYDSIVDDIVDSEIEEGHILNDDDIDYRHIFKEMSRSILDDILELFNDEFDLFSSNDYITYECLYSPKYYNFSTDKIEAMCEDSVYLTLLNRFKDDKEFIEYLNEASISRDGFTSFYEGIEQVSKEPSIFLEYLFEWFVLNKYRDEIIDKTTDNLNEIIYNNLTQ